MSGTVGGATLLAVDVTAIQGVPVDDTAPTNGQALIYDSGTGMYVPGATGGAPSGAAGGDLGGTYPNPTVTDLTIASEARGDLLRRNASAWGRLALGAVGTIPRSDGTDIVYSTATFPDTAARGTILAATGTNAVTAVTASTANTFVGGDGTDVTTRTAAQVKTSLYPNTTVDLSDATGWTTDADGTATAVMNTGAGTIDLTVPAGGNYARAGHAPWTYERMDLRVRVVTMSGDGTSADFVQMGVGDALGATVYMVVRARDNDTVVCEVDGVPTVSSPVTVTNLTAGQGWLRLVVDGLTARSYAGVGSGGAEPTSWTATGNCNRSGTAALIPWAFVNFQANRAGAGTVTAVLSTITYTVLQ